MARPVPVGQEVEHGGVGPLALVEVEAVLREAAGVDHARRGALERPSGLAEVVDAGPHEVARDVVVEPRETPEPFHVDDAAQADPEASSPGPAAFHEPAVVAAWTAHRAMLGSDHPPVGVRLAVHVVVPLALRPPAVHVVVAHDVEFGEQVQTGAALGRVGGHVVERHRDGSRGVLSSERRHELAQGLRAACVSLVGDLVARAPEDDRRMVAVPSHEVRDVASVPLVEQLDVAVLGAVGEFGDLPLVERLRHYEEAHPVAEVEELAGDGVVARADRVAAHRPQEFQPPLPDPLGNRRADRPRIVVQAHAVELDVLAVEKESALRVEGRLADAEGRRRIVDAPTVPLDRRGHVVHRGRFDGPEARLLDLEGLDELRLSSGGDGLARLDRLEARALVVHHGRGEGAQGSRLAVVADGRP